MTSPRFATLMLLLATAGWGVGFTWAKAAQEAVNRNLGLPPGGILGPLLTLGVRFSLAGLLMLAVVPRARTGWSKVTFRRALALGGLLWAANGLQHWGLGLTSEAVSAFLTSLSILFVPLVMTAFLRASPGRNVWLAVIVAMAGIWLMTGATATGFGLGEALGVACALVFSIYILATNTLVPRDDPWRMASGQFLISGLAFLMIGMLYCNGTIATSRDVLEAFGDYDVWRNLVLSLLFPTLLSFTLMMSYQPRLPAARVALIYVLEPIFAAAYAYVERGRSPGAQGLVGAALILAANVTVELSNQSDAGDDREDADRQRNA